MSIPIFIFLSANPSYYDTEWRFSSPMQRFMQNFNLNLKKQKEALFILGIINSLIIEIIKIAEFAIHNFLFLKQDCKTFIEHKTLAFSIIPYLSLLSAKFFVCKNKLNAKLLDVLSIIFRCNVELNAELPQYMESKFWHTRHLSKEPVVSWLFLYFLANGKW